MDSTKINKKTPLGFKGKGNHQQTRAILTQAASQFRTVGELAHHLHTVRLMEQMLLKGDRP
ncbi:hypothetical protein [Desulfobotulus sp.]|uniref:hypothetical protein n=1 Tax=Desulfobotulus sp. TaxID=1940337 RepID=UPI002A36F375|nr:hypothetical protein [Desulfobotulus sp.]MDY0164621.1 hypothetical protein [Desulfobotulus sp.]